jgi:Ca2+-binding RTX toxin-like protein
VTLTNAKTGYRVVQDLTVGVEFVPINGTVGADTLKGTAGWDTLNGLAGNDMLTGGTGLDTFLVTSGRDTILDFNALTTVAVGSEVLRVSEGATADATLKAAWTATNDSFNDGTANLITKGMAVDLSGITLGQGWNVTNTGAAAMIKGSQFNDVLIGGSSNDQLLGGAGSDVLAGSKGYDILTGGAGNDTFRLGGDTKTDHITDFLSGTDRIELDNALFKALLTEGQLAANQFAQGTASTTATQRIVYDQPTGNLWYDRDGSGKGNAELIGVLDNHVQVTLTDFYII